MEHWRDLELPEHWDFAREDGPWCCLTLEWAHGLLGEVVETEIISAPAARWRRLAYDILRELGDDNAELPQPRLWDKLRRRFRRSIDSKTTIRILE